MTAVTKTYIANLALRLIGTERINDITDDSPSADIVNDVWEVARLEALSSHEWRFASKVAYLQRGTDPDYGYDYRYQVPADFVRLNAVYSDAAMTSAVRDYELREGYIHAGYEAIYLDYVGDNNTPGSWPAWFVSYMAAVIAMHMSSTQKSTSETERVEKLADKRLAQARMLDSTQQPVRKPPPGTWIRAARGNYRTI